MIQCKQISTVFAIATAIGAAAWLGFDAGVDKVKTNENTKRSIEQCANIRSMTAVLSSSRYLYFMRLAGDIKIGLTDQDLQELRHAVTAGVSAATGARSWCKRKLLSSSIDVDSPRDYAYPHTTYDGSPRISLQLVEKISSKLNKSIPEVFGDQVIDKWFKGEGWQQ